MKVFFVQILYIFTPCNIGCISDCVSVNFLVRTFEWGTNNCVLRLGLMLLICVDTVAHKVGSCLPAEVSLRLGFPCRSLHSQWFHQFIVAMINLEYLDVVGQKVF